MGMDFASGDETEITFIFQWIKVFVSLFHPLGSKT